MTDPRWPSDAAVLRAYNTFWAKSNSGATGHECMLAALLAADRMAWQKIETAPLNESILIWVPQTEHYGPGIWRAIHVDMGTGKHWLSTGLHVGRDLGDPYRPTMWRSLPAPPARGDGE